MFLLSSSQIRRPRGSRRGVSLLELLFTISLLTVVLVAFAAVYPSGYKLNRKSAKASIAAKTAEALADEVQALPFSEPTNVPPGSIPTLNFLNNPANVPTFVATQMRTYIPDGFTLPPGGLQVEVFPPSAQDPPETPNFAEITVTIYWTDSNSPNLQRQISVKTAKTDNQVAR